MCLSVVEVEREDLHPTLTITSDQLPVADVVLGRQPISMAHPILARACSAQLHESIAIERSAARQRQEQGEHLASQVKSSQVRSS